MKKQNYSLRELEDYLSEYIDGTCPSEIRAQIEAEAKRNDEFASLLMFEQQISKSLDLPKEYTPSRSVDHNFTRLKARINAEENKPSFLQGLFNWIKAPVPAMFAVCFAVLVAVAIQSPDNNEFVTLSDHNGTAINTENVHLIRVIFTNENSPSKLDSFEKQYSLNLIKGPDSLGSYIFALDKSNNADTLVTNLNDDPTISFAGKTVSP